MSHVRTKSIVYAVKALINAVANLEAGEDIDEGDWEVLNEFYEL